MTRTRSRFPFFNEVPAPAGRRGLGVDVPLLPGPLARRPEDEEDTQFWFADTMHWSRGAPPVRQHRRRGRVPGRRPEQHPHLRPPGVAGPGRARACNGYVYISPIAVTDPEEIGRRAELFQERAGYYYAELGRALRPVEDQGGRRHRCACARISFPPLGELRPDRGRHRGPRPVHGHGTSSPNYHRLIDEFFLVWQYHFEFLNLGYGGYIVFFQFCKQAFPEITDQQIARMVAGVDVLAFRPDDELRKLAALAIDWAGRRASIAGDAAGAVLAALGGTRQAAGPGSRTLRERQGPVVQLLRRVRLHPRPGHLGQQPVDPAARASPATPASCAPARTSPGPWSGCASERDEIVDEYRALLTGEEAAQFDELLGLARKVFPYIEEHNIYVEHWTHSVFWEKAWELGDFLVVRRLHRAARRRLLPQPLRARRRCCSTSSSPGRSACPPAARSAGPRRSSAAAASWPRCRPPPPRRRTASRRTQVTDPFAVMNYGVTTERVQAWLGAGDEADATRSPASPARPGVVEGPVRVLRSEKDLGDLQPGEILVCPITAPSWASAFSVAAGRDHRHRRDDVPRRDRLPRVRHPGRRRHRLRHHVA